MRVIERTKDKCTMGKGVESNRHRANIEPISNQYRERTEGKPRENNFRKMLQMANKINFICTYQKKVLPLQPN